MALYSIGFSLVTIMEAELLRSLSLLSVHCSIPPPFLEPVSAICYGLFITSACGRSPLLTGWNISIGRLIPSNS